MKQLVRYLLIGVTSNLIGYLTYITLTWLHIGPKIAMTMVYITGASIGYFGNRLWTFPSSGKVTSAMLKYGLAHTLGYVVNFFILYIFVDQLFFNHLFVQAIAIFVVASFLFVISKNFVFKN